MTPSSLTQWADITNPHWWLGVVLVGIVINVASRYLQRPIDRGLDSISRKRATRTAARAEERRRRIAQLRGNEIAQLFALIESSHRELRSLTFLMLATFGLVIAMTHPDDFRLFDIVPVKPTMLTFALFTVFLGMSAGLRAIARRDEVYEARRPPANDDV